MFRSMRRRQNGSSLHAARDAMVSGMYPLCGLPTQRLPEEVTLPCSKWGYVIGVSHLLCLLQCLLGKLGKCRVGSECQIHVPVR